MDVSWHLFCHVGTTQEEEKKDFHSQEKLAKTSQLISFSEMKIKAKGKMQIILSL